MSIPLRVLIVEDSDDDLLLLLRELRRAGYEPHYARVETRAEMLAAITTQPWEIILSDYALPHFSGRDALKLCQELEVDIPFLIISGTIGEGTAVEMMKAGANDYLMKGSLTRLGPAIGRELNEYHIRRERQQAEQSLRESEHKFSLFMDHLPVQVFIKDHTGKLTYVNRRFREAFLKTEWAGRKMEELLPPGLASALLDDDSTARAGELVQHTGVIPGKDGENSTIYIETMKFLIPRQDQPPLLGGICWDITDRWRGEEQLRRAAEDLAVAYDATLEGWSYALELREKETAGHSQRVVALTLALARLLDIPENQLIHLRRGALLHDIGKMGIPDQILLKPGPLSTEEWEVMRLHPVYAHDWLSRIPYLKPALEIPHLHHERWNGQGYPKGLQGEGIPLSARIFALVDVWDALTADRPYRPAWSQREAREYVQAQSGQHFDPQVVNAFMEYRTCAVL